MRDAVPKDLLAYVVVCLPEPGHWQGFFVVPHLAAAGDRMLAQVREMGGETPPPGAGPSETLHGLPGVAEADQPAVGMLSAVLCDLLARGTVQPQPPLAVAQALLDTTVAAAYALHRVTGERWLLVTGTRDMRGGYRSQVRKFDAADVDEAREAIVTEIGRARTMRGIGDAFMTEIMDLQERRRRGA